MASVRGLRLFFPLALAFAGIWVPIWVVGYVGLLPLPGHFLPAQWHGHEMIFGYVAAAVAGFVTVADRGWRIVGLACLWLAGRMLLLFDAEVPPSLIVVVDVSFLPLLVLLRRPRLWKGGKLMMVAITGAVLLLSLLNVWGHLSALGGGAAGANETAVAAVVLLLVAVAGRLVPGHTRAATRRGAGLSLTGSELASIAFSVALVGSVAVGMRFLSGGLAAILGGLQAYRLYRWWDPGILRDPLLWGLHLGFAWLVIGLGLHAAAELTAADATTSAQHVILVGAVGTLTVAIMLRLTLAHARRPQRGTAADGIVFVLLGIAALARGVVPMLAPQFFLWGSTLAALAWSAAYAVALGRHLRIAAAS